MEFPPDKTLLVEGRDDLHVVAQLLKQHGIESSSWFRIEDLGGYELLVKRLPALIRQHHGEENAKLGVMVDANENLPARWESVTKAFRDAGYSSIPDQPQKGGLVVPPYNDFSPTIGIWVMPDNEKTGMLEDFTQFLVLAGDDLIGYANQCVNSIETPRFKPSYTSKAVIHTWLAWQDDPGAPLGQAVLKKYLDSDCPQAGEFVNWIKTLFEISTP